MMNASRKMKVDKRRLPWLVDCGGEVLESSQRRHLERNFPPLKDGVERDEARSSLANMCRTILIDILDTR